LDRQSVELFLDMIKTVCPLFSLLFFAYYFCYYFVFCKQKKKKNLGST
jgi:hypothetical protein